MFRRSSALLTCVMVFTTPLLAFADVPTTSTMDVFNEQCRADIVRECLAQIEPARQQNAIGPRFVHGRNEIYNIPAGDQVQRCDHPFNHAIVEHCLQRIDITSMADPVLKDIKQHDDDTTKVLQQFSDYLKYLHSLRTKKKLESADATTPPAATTTPSSSNN